MHKNKPNISFITQNDICTGCGICQATCANGAIKIHPSEGRFLPKIDSNLCKNDKGCHQCFDSCPGIGINLQKSAENCFSSDLPSERIVNPYMGSFIRTFIGHSNDYNMRFHSASGGSLSQFLIYLLEHNIIDGAVVSKFDPKSPLKVKSFIARTKDEIISARSSKYAPVSLHDAICEIKKTDCTRIVVVGVPCQIEGMRKLMSINRKIREKIYGLFSLYCSGSRTFYFTEYVMKERKIDLDKLSYLAYRDNGCLGGLVAKGDGIDYYEDYQRYCHPLRSIFYPHRCILCADHFGELSDISFGDIHKAPYSEDKVGINSIIVRNSKWNSLLTQAAENDVLTLKPIDHQEILNAQKMAYAKKKRNISFAMIEKKMGRNVPDFGSTYDAKISIKSILDYAQMSMQRLIGKRKWLWWLIPFLKAKVNIH